MEWTVGNTITVSIFILTHLATFAYFMGKLKTNADNQDKRMKDLEIDVYDHLSNESKHANKGREEEYQKRIEERFNQSDANFRELKQTIAQNFHTTQSLIEGLRPKTRNRE